MITSLQLENYRGFQEYTVPGLARANLLVGKNNCGKTALLEAVHLLASGGDAEVLFRFAMQRGEAILVPDDRERYGREAYPVARHYFFGHDFVVGMYFRVSSGDGIGAVRISVISLSDLDESQAALVGEGTRLQPAAALRCERSAGPTTTISRDYPVTEEGALIPGVLARSRRPFQRDRNGGLNVQFITPDSLEPTSMSDMWNKVLTMGREADVIGAMRILAPGLRNVVFLSGRYPYGGPGRAGVLADFEGTPHRNPLGSYGDGMRRLLALTLSLIQSENGILLVDEIDTGLHYSIMEEMWRLVVETARRANVQVFATTHSSDCVRGLASLCRDRPDLRGEVSLQKIDPSIKEAVALNWEKIIIAVDQGIEVR